MFNEIGGIKVTSFSKEIAEWRLIHDRKFATKEIFREEFFAFIDGILFIKFQEELDKIQRISRESFSAILKEINGKQDDNRYAIMDLKNEIRILSDLAIPKKPKKK